MKSLFILILAIQWAAGAKILAVFPMPAKSHHNVFRPMILELAKRGHQITFLTPIPVKNPPANLKQIVIPDYLSEIHGQVNILEFGKLNVPMTSFVMWSMGDFLCEKVFSGKEFQSLIHSNEKYDAVFSESLFIQEAMSALMHKFDAIGIDIQPLGECSWVNELAGIPDNPAYMIDYKSLYTDSMSYLERLHNAYTTYATTLISYLSMWSVQRQVDKYFNYTGWETRPPIRQLMSNKSLILINSHFSVGYSYPKAPHVKEIGGINIVPNQPLPKDLQDFMDGAKDGVIYFSFGSNVKVADTINSGQFEHLVKTFGKLKQRVLWKWESDEIPKVPNNIKMSKWFPQQDILAHKNIKIFITHGGVLSIFEAVHHGVPLIAVPFFGDQEKNVRQIIYRGYGIHLNFENITETSMTWAINEILTNPSYKEAAKQRSQLLRDKPRSSLEEAVYWIEYVLKHKNVLQPQSVHLPFYQLHMLDVLIPFFLILMFVIVILFKITKKILCWIFKKSKKTNVDMKKKKK